MDAATRAHIETGHTRLAHYITKLANEPSLGLWHVQNHIHASMPKLVETKKEVQRRTAQVEGLVQDTNYSQQTVKVVAASPSFEQTKRHLQTSISSLEALIRSTNTQVARSPPPPASVIPVISPGTVGATSAAVVSLASAFAASSSVATPPPSVLSPTSASSTPMSPSHAEQLQPSARVSDPSSRESTSPSSTSSFSPAGPLPPPTTPIFTSQPASPTGSTPE